MKLIVLNLPRDVSEEDLAKLFEEFGQIKACNLVHDAETGNSKGFGFVEREGGDDLFVHKSDVDGFINEGDKVEFEIGEGQKGPAAQQVKKSA